MDVVTKKSGRSVADRRKRLRESLWPAVTDEQLWLRSQNIGFTTIPRTMPWIGQILDHLSGKGVPVFSTYLTLWCWVFDEAVIEIRNPREFALEAGFSGTRAEGTWRSRMRRLEELKFIATKKGLAGEFQYVLLINPLLRIREVYEGNHDDPLYLALLSRLAAIGADDLEV